MGKVGSLSLVGPENSPLSDEFRREAHRALDMAMDSCRVIESVTLSMVGPNYVKRMTGQEPPDRGIGCTLILFVDGGAGRTNEELAFSRHDAKARALGLRK